jgi:hypothetical protein
MFETEEADRKAQIISAVCAELAADQIENGAAILRDRYPFVPFRMQGAAIRPSRAYRFL